MHRTPRQVYLRRDFPRGSDRHATNSVGQPNLVGVREQTLHNEGVDLSYAFPPHSVTVLEFRL
jgi:hypothetical protein